MSQNLFIVSRKLFVDVKRLCFGQREFTASFVFLNAPPGPRDFELHCGIDYRLKASRKNCKDDGECASGYSPPLKVQSASIHQFITEYQHRDTSRCDASMSVPLGMKIFHEYREETLFFNVTMLA